MGLRGKEMMRLRRGRLRERGSVLQVAVKASAGTLVLWVFDALGV